MSEQAPTVTITREVCPTCDGEGYPDPLDLDPLWDDEDEECSECGGTGVVLVPIEREARDE